MGSFSELVLSFDFRADTPDEVLAAFSALHKPLPAGSRRGPEPPLPPPVVENPEGTIRIRDQFFDWEPDWEDMDEDAEDIYAAEPWRHEWAPQLSGSYSVATETSAALVWSQMGRWNFSCRSSFKMHPRGVFDCVKWLGPFIRERGGKTWVGTIMFEIDERPCLLWNEDGEMSLENLNPPEWTDW